MWQVDYGIEQAAMEQAEFERSRRTEGERVNLHNEILFKIRKSVPKTITDKDGNEWKLSGSDFNYMEKTVTYSLKHK